MSCFDNTAIYLMHCTLLRLIGTYNLARNGAKRQENQSDTVGTASEARGRGQRKKRAPSRFLSDTDSSDDTLSSKEDNEPAAKKRLHSKTNKRSPPEKGDVNAEPDNDMMGALKSLLTKQKQKSAEIAIASKPMPMNSAVSISSEASPFLAYPV